MTTSFIGIAANADWTTPLVITLDGEPFQAGLPSAPSQGNYLYWIRAILDRTMWLKSHAGIKDAGNTWTEDNVWSGAGKTARFDPTLSQVILQTDLNVGQAAAVNITSGTSIHVKNNGSLVLEAGSIVSDASDRTYSGTVTFTGPVIHSGAGALQEDRVGQLGSGPVVHATTDNDVWELEADPTSDQEVRLNEPTDTTKPWRMTVTRNQHVTAEQTVFIKDDNSGTQLCVFNAQGFNIQARSGGGAGETVTTAVAYFAWADFRWRVSTGKWILVRGGGESFNKALTYPP